MRALSLVSLPVLSLVLGSGFFLPRAIQISVIIRTGSGKMRARSEIEEDFRSSIFGSSQWIVGSIGKDIVFERSPFPEPFGCDLARNHTEFSEEVSDRKSPSTGQGEIVVFGAERVSVAA